MFSSGVNSIAAMASRSGFTQSNRGFPLQGLINNSMQSNNFSSSPGELTSKNPFLYTLFFKPLPFLLSLESNCLRNRKSVWNVFSALDLSEFPSLTNRSSQENSNASMSHNPMAGRPPYGKNPLWACKYRIVFEM